MAINTPPGSMCGPTATSEEKPIMQSLVDAFEKQLAEVEKNVRFVNNKISSFTSIFTGDLSGWSTSSVINFGNMEKKDTKKEMSVTEEIQSQINRLEKTNEEFVAIKDMLNKLI